MTLIKKAEQLATLLHKGQTRWDGSPYIEHPRRVADSLEGKNPQIVVAAWLHDCVEDSEDKEAVMATIKDTFGPVVLGWVLVLTHTPADTYVEYIKKVSKNYWTSLVKIADLKDNLRDLEPGQRRDKYEFALLLLKSKWEYK